MHNARNLRPVIIAAILFAFLLIFGFSPYARPYTQLTDNISLPGLSTKDATIPNIVHYVMLKKDDHSTLQFRFDHFLSIYASFIYLSPTVILLHTDHNASAIADAVVNGDRWTRLVLTLPTVKTNEVVSPQNTEGTNRPIRKIEHKSDFVRIDQLHRTGGLYMDLDVIPLRDLKPLRQAGFKAVVGRQLHGGINNGVILAQKGAALTALMQREGPLVFNGGWETHSIKLITPIAQRLARYPGEVLIMDEPAFSPTSWIDSSNDHLFGPHNDTAPAEEEGVLGLEHEQEDPIAWWDRKAEKTIKWEMDFSQSYVLHAYRSRSHKVPGFEGVTPNYVQRRDSNYALVVWPVLKHALNAGIVEASDLDV
jgi:hypothetical protein